MEFKRRLREADAILIVTPEYHYSMPGVLKNAIDWASRPHGDVADIAQAFAQVWAMPGEPIPEHELVRQDALAPAGATALRVAASMPATAGLFRLDQLVAALARKRLWLTDAYYAGTTAYVQALRAAAKDGVDVRLLVPNGTDIPRLKPLSRAGYPPLLAAGVRVFEWNGTMLHAKTAVSCGATGWRSQAH